MKKIAILLSIVVVFLSGCNFSNQKLAKKMIEKYSDDQSYVTLVGEVVEFCENNVTIKCAELNKYINYQGELCEYYVHCEKMLNLSAGNQIEFVTVPFHFFNGHKLPIVELKVDGTMLLSRQKGKANLIAWVNANFR